MNNIATRTDNITSCTDILSIIINTKTKAFSTLEKKHKCNSDQENRIDGSTNPDTMKMETIR